MNHSCSYRKRKSALHNCSPAPPRHNPLGGGGDIRFSYFFNHTFYTHAYTHTRTHIYIHIYVYRHSLEVSGSSGVCPSAHAHADITYTHMSYVYIYIFYKHISGQLSPSLKSRKRKEGNFFNSQAKWSQAELSQAKLKLRQPSFSCTTFSYPAPFPKKKCHPKTPREPLLSIEGSDWEGPVFVFTLQKEKRWLLEEARFQTDAERTRFRSRGLLWLVVEGGGSTVVGGEGGGAGCYFFLAWSISMSSVCEGALPLICL